MLQQLERDDASADALQFEHLVAEGVLRPEDGFVTESNEHLAVFATYQVSEFDANAVPLITSSAILVGSGPVLPPGST